MQVSCAAQAASSFFFRSRNHRSPLTTSTLGALLFLPTSALAQDSPASAPEVFDVQPISIEALGMGMPIVNAPVAPEAIYVGRAGTEGGLSIIDLNGFGAGTGNPRFDATYQVFREGWSHFPLNPNLIFMGALLRPPLFPGATTATGGSSGVLRLALDSDLEDILADSLATGSIADIAIGQPLDKVYNNAIAPFGCTSGGGNLCAINGLQVLRVDPAGGHSLAPAVPGSPGIHTVLNGGNPISWAPHPNPPALVMPPLCQVPLIEGNEPTSIDSAAQGFVNLLVPGDAFGDPSQGIPPSGLLARESNTYFVGPSSPGVPLSACREYAMRQQVGHFLYLADRTHDEVVVMNSNRVSVIARIPVADPTDFAMSPNLDLLAVTSRSRDEVSFLDIDPESTTFHQVVKRVPVGRRPRGIAWDPGNEDILVCCEGSNSVFVLSAFSLDVRKVVNSGLRRPFDIAITQRQQGFGFERSVYYAYILNREGTISVFESGPAGVNGWGYDDVIGRLPFLFQEPKSIQPDPTDLRSAVWIAHSGPIDTTTGQAGSAAEGALSKLVFDSGTVGMLPLLAGSSPQFRNQTYAVEVSVGSEQLSGKPVDLAFDDMVNLGALANVSSAFSAGTPAEINGKSMVRDFAGNRTNTNAASYLFVPIPVPEQGGHGVIDVIDLATGQRIDTNPFQDGLQSIPARGATVVSSYFRQ